MRALRLAAAVIAAFLTASLASPAGAALPQLALACAPAQAGQDAACSITRLSGGRGVYLLFQTSDGTARAALDYTAVSKQVYLPAGQQSASIAVHTRINPAATGALTFNAAVAGGAAVVRAIGSIVEPAQPPPAPPPTPVPTSQWIPAPLTVGGYACSKWQAGPCGSGIVYRITGAMMSADAVPVQQYTAVFDQDASGQFPLGDSFAVNFVGTWAATDLVGIAPAP